MKKENHQYHDYLNVPIELCAYSLQNKKTNPIRTFLFLKSISLGYVKNSNEVFLRVSSNLNICKKTVINHKNWLIKEGWIIPDFEVNSFRIISFKLLASKLGFISAAGALLYKTEIKNYISFAVAAVTQYYLMRIKRRKHLTELNMWSSKTGKFPPYPHLSHTYLAKVLKISKTSVSRYKILSQKDQYLKSYKKFEDLEIPLVDLNLYKIYGPYEPAKLKKIGTTIVKQLPNEIRCNIKLRKKYELREICQKNRLEKKVEPLNVVTFNQ